MSIDETIEAADADGRALTATLADHERWRSAGQAVLNAAGALLAIESAHACETGQDGIEEIAQRIIDFTAALARFGVNVPDRLDTLDRPDRLASLAVVPPAVADIVAAQERSRDPNWRLAEHVYRRAAEGQSCAQVANLVGQIVNRSRTECFFETYVCRSLPQELFPPLKPEARPDGWEADYLFQPVVHSDGQVDSAASFHGWLNQQIRLCAIGGNRPSDGHTARNAIRLADHLGVEGVGVPEEPPSGWTRTAEEMFLRAMLRNVGEASVGRRSTNDPPFGNGPGKRKEKGKRGPKGLTPEDRNVKLKLLEDWRAAKRSGVKTIAEFADHRRLDAVILRTDLDAARKIETRKPRQVRRT